MPIYGDSFYPAISRLELSLADFHLSTFAFLSGAVTMYQILDEMRVLRLEDAAIIPVSDGNTDYQAYLEWVDVGGIALPPEPVAPMVPQSVTRYQARAALLEVGLLDDVEEYFAALPTASLARLAWQEAPTVNRISDALAGAAESLGIDENQLDHLFLRASTFS